MALSIQLKICAIFWIISKSVLKSNLENVTHISAQNAIVVHIGPFYLGNMSLIQGNRIPIFLSRFEYSLGTLFHVDFCICYVSLLQPRTPEKIHKFRCTTQSAPGRTRIFYGRYGDPDVASLLTHGVDTKPSLQVMLNFDSN